MLDYLKRLGEVYVALQNRQIPVAGCCVVAVAGHDPVAKIVVNSEHWHRAVAYCAEFGVCPSAGPHPGVPVLRLQGVAIWPATELTSPASWAH